MAFVASQEPGLESLAPSTEHRFPQQTSFIVGFQVIRLYDEFLPSKEVIQGHHSTPEAEGKVGVHNHGWPANELERHGASLQGGQPGSLLFPGRPRSISIDLWSGSMLPPSGKAQKPLLQGGQGHSTRIALAPDGEEVRPPPDKLTFHPAVK